LIKEETQAIHEKNIEAIHSLAAKKTPILIALEALESIINQKNGDHADKKKRLNLLTHQQSQNLDAFSKLTQDITKERNSLEKTKSQQTKIQSTYYSLINGSSNRFYA
jgi:hypothetical protein